MKEQLGDEYVSSVLEALEAGIAEYVGTRYAVACSSARSALRFSLLGLGIGHGDEVVIPDFACQILPITVFCTGATPVFCDIDRKTSALSPAVLPSVLRSNTKAIIFIHPFGLPVDPSPVLEIASEKGIAFIDDGAQALGSSINSRKVGSFGDIGILTFNKFLDVDIGGAATTDDRELASKVRLIRENHENKWLSTALAYRAMEATGLKSRKAMRLIFAGSNSLYKFLNITLRRRYFREISGWVTVNANLLQSWTSNTLTTAMVDQLMTYAGRYWHAREMEQIELLHLQKELAGLEPHLQNRRKIARTYDDHLSQGNFDKIQVQQNSLPSYMRYPILAKDSHALAKCIQDLQLEGFWVDYRYKPLHMSPFFNWTTKGSSFKESTYLSEHILPLPITDDMSIEQAMKVAAIANHDLSQ